MGRLAAAILVAFVAGVVLSHTHSHEPAHMKYTREVNEAAADEDHGHAHEHHGHAHGPGGCPHAHAHSHEAHGHAHEEAHGHAHDHAHADHAHSHGGHGHSHDSHTAKKRDVHVEEVKYEGFLSFINDAKTRLWVHAIGATLLISAAPCFILMFIPIQDATSAESGPLLKVLLSFGSGGLLGDAFLHLIPHATPAGDGHAHSHSHSHSEGGHSHAPHDMSVGGWVLAGIIAFLVVEKVVRIIRGEDGHGHSHGHSHGGKKEKCSDDESDEKKKGGDKKKKGEKKEDAPREIKVAAYLNLVADFAHNFTDGLAIGASFIAGTTVGVVTMVTVLVHEVPHEIGDFAILIQSGYSKKKAMLVQLVTALGALSGCVLSLWAADTSLADAAASSWVLPFTAGGFIYIATVSVMPELLENSSSWQSIKEMIALGLGIFMMYLIAIFE